MILLAEIMSNKTSLVYLSKDVLLEQEHMLISCIFFFFWYILKPLKTCYVTFQSVSQKFEAGSSIISLKSLTLQKCSLYDYVYMLQLRNSTPHLQPSWRWLRGAIRARAINGKSLHSSLEPQFALLHASVNSDSKMLLMFYRPREMHICMLSGNQPDTCIWLTIKV